MIAGAANIDCQFLRRKFPQLARLEKMGISLEGMGETMVREVERGSSRQQIRTGAFSGAAPSPLVDWRLGSAAIIGLLSSEAQAAQATRDRLPPSSTATTPLLLTTLSLWLAGHLRKSVTLTTPLVAAILLATARDGIESFASLLLEAAK